MTDIPRAESDSSARAAILVMRWVWGVLLFGLVVMGCFISAICVIYADDSSDPSDLVFELILAGVAVPSVFVAYVGRMQTYKRLWIGNAVSPSGYVLGNMLFFTFLLAAGLTGWTGVLLAFRLNWELALPVAVMALFAINFPTGRPMRQAGPRVSP